jgi:hypothetical protein
MGMGLKALARYAEKIQPRRWVTRTCERFVMDFT